MVAENKNWFGGELMPEKNIFEKVPTPDSQRYWKTVGPASKWVSDKLNDWTGGSQVRKGIIDISPETLDLITDTIGGSALRFFTDSASTPYKFFNKEKVAIQDIPFARRVYGQKSEWTDQRVYYDNLTQVLTAKEELETYKGSDFYKDLANDLRDYKRMIPIADETEKRIRKLRRLRNKSNNQKQIELYNKQIEQLYISFNKKYYSIVK